MSRETPGEPAGAEQHWRRLWQKMLREPDALPGQGLADKDAAWDTLFERLNAKPRRRFFGFRIAAACILIALIPVSRLFHDRPGSGRPGTHLTAGGKGVPVAEKIRPGAEKVRSAAPASAPGIETRPIAPAPVAAASIAPKKPLLKKHPVVSQTAPAVLISVAKPIPAPPAIILAENILPQAPKPAPKKQWKVVDINDLEPRDSRPQMVADRQPRPLRLGLGLGNSGFPENPAARGEESRLKINLTIQNH